MKRGVNTIEDLRVRSIIDPVTHCWHWQGAKIKGRPRIWTADLDAMDKRVLGGARAVWYIAHGTRLHHAAAYMGCWCADCVCPVHVRRGTMAEVLANAVRAGRFAGRSEAKTATALRMRIAAGHVDTAPDVVLALRAAKGTASGAALARQFGLSKSVACRILRGQTYR